VIEWFQNYGALTAYGTVAYTFATIAIASITFYQLKAFREDARRRQEDSVKRDAETAKEQQRALEALRNRLEKTSRTMSLYERLELDPLLNEYSLYVRELSENGSDYSQVRLSDPKTYVAVITIINTYDGICAGTLANVYDEELVFDLFGPNIGHVYTTFLKPPFVQPEIDVADFQSLLTVYTRIEMNECRRAEQATLPNKN